MRTVVVLVRAQCLSDEIRAALAVVRLDGRFPSFALLDMDFAAQRLASSCERELGIRDRATDLMRRAMRDTGL
jgi:hypothetical protein